jgi:hypothetical protein
MVATPDRPWEGRFRMSLVQYDHAIGRAYATTIWIRNPEVRSDELIGRKRNYQSSYVSRTSMMSVW